MQRWRSKEKRFDENQPKNNNNIKIIAHETNIKESKWVKEETRE